ncbi:MAG: Gfo/Idh/MocA family oxidoreductase [Alphaproteobacteria bacterium]|jgi:predicted dehydrogenase|nr:Gfo/Idh/MocA family oxidoreductase [Alphaproteobacteria bacterium]
MTQPVRKILQIGFGNFGPTHLAAWRELGLADGLYVVDPGEAARQRCRDLGLPRDRVGADVDAFLDLADLIVVLAPTDKHFKVCKPLLATGKPLFIEKPMTATLAEAEGLRELCGDQVVQIGFYFRAHPLAKLVRDEISAGRLGDLRYISARFHGYKRARGDSGVIGNDAVHFIDQANWMMGGLPVAVDAVSRDHFDRGYDDLALIRLFYPSGAIANIEVGCIQPGRWNDNIVPGSTQTKEFVVAGTEGAAEIDYQTSELRLHRVRHELIDGLWRPNNRGVEMPHAAIVEPHQVVAGEFAAFLDAVDGTAAPLARMDECGVGMARVLDAIYRSAEQEMRISL